MASTIAAKPLCSNDIVRSLASGTAPFSLFLSTTAVAHIFEGLLYATHAYQVCTNKASLHAPCPLWLPADVTVLGTYHADGPWQSRWSAAYFHPGL